MNWKNYLSIFLILAFAFEILVLSFANNNDNITNNNNSSISATPQPILFQGTGITKMVVMNLSGKAYFECAQEKQDLTDIINKSKFFDNIIKNQPGFYRLTFPQTWNYTRFASSSVKMETLVKKYCNSTQTYRLGQIQLLEPEINVTSPDGKTQIISTQQVENYFYSQGSRINALVFPTSRANLTGFVRIILTTHDYAIDPKQGDTVIMQEINPYEDILNQLLQQDKQMDKQKELNANKTKNQTIIILNNTNLTNSNVTNKTG